ncbi:DUF5131 family protein [Pseudomonas tohonis]|uniref:DUF5131 family protein n=1 Tax=Pseudomonas tohonis TaxID=2725477 RepID=A0ABQ4W6L3_9PSED|nr:DUF5131 family protein [Pseudomonas tohonis]GJN55097.1 hypothetical protein TUM20286_48490 [Pseudomonas tohonis]
MSTQTRIEWTEMTWNPIVGRTKVSPACKNCYAENMVQRLQAMGTHTLPSDAWLGGSMEDRAYGIPRMDYLRQVPAAIRLLPTAPRLEDLYRLDLTDIHRVIVGGKSENRARQMKQKWAEIPLLQLA